MKSPLKANISYKSLNCLKQLIPEGSTVSSFLLYDGAIELSLAECGRTVVAHTNRRILYDFWQELMIAPVDMAALCKNMKESMLQPEFELLQETLPTYTERNIRAAFFYMLNRCSDNGFVSCGRIDKSKFTAMSIAHLKKFRVERFYPFYDNTDDALGGISRASKTDYLLIPAGKYNFNLFEHGKSRGYEMANVNHRQLYNLLREMKRKWVVLYKNHPRVLKLYEDYNMTFITKYGRPTNNRELCEEIVIANF